MGRIYENDFDKINITNDTEILLEEGDLIVPNDNPCRICLEHNSSSKRYCHCKGTLGSVHEDCLLEWFLYKNKLTGEKIYCEICKTEIVANYIKKNGYYVVHTIEIAFICIFFFIIVGLVIFFHKYSIFIIIISLPIFSCIIVITSKIADYIVNKLKLEEYKLIPIP